MGQCKLVKPVACGGVEVTSGITDGLTSVNWIRTSLSQYT